PVRSATRREIIGFTDGLLYVLDDTTLAPKAMNRVSGVTFGYDILLNAAATRALIMSNPAVFADLEQLRAIDQLDIGDMRVTADSDENRAIVGGGGGVRTKIHM